MSHWVLGLIVALLVGSVHAGIGYHQRTEERAEIEQRNRRILERWRGERGAFEDAIRDLPENMDLDAEQFDRIAREQWRETMERLEAPVPLPPDPVHWLDRLFVALGAGGLVTLGAFLWSQRKREPKIARHF